MKKKYVTPTMKSYQMMYMQILAGSDPDLTNGIPGDGNTSTY